MQQLASFSLRRGQFDGRQGVRRPELALAVAPAVDRDVDGRRAGPARGLPERPLLGQLLPPITPSATITSWRWRFTFGSLAVK
jgi:hypothetical protein